ncbi:hypothetical protein LXL04_038017 [Taraxacum kok-saghyz]
MYKMNSIPRAVIFVFLMALIEKNHAAVVNVKTKGAKGDGKSDDGPAIISAWKEACGGPPPSSVLFPAGTYFVAPPLHLKGPCKGPIEIKATGATIKAPPEVAKFKTEGWIEIEGVDKLTLTGGNYDGQGQATWKSNNCASTGVCKLPAVSTCVSLKLVNISLISIFNYNNLICEFSSVLRISNIRLTNCKNAVVKDLTSTNSKFFHINILGCDNAKLDHVTINAPGTSLNTDGIHIGRLNGLNITNTNIKTGDDCISFGDGSKNVHIEKVTCGPGHGISIGSLGRWPNELPVQGIWIKNCTITGTNNGARIKSWPDGTPGTASDMHFEDIIMENVGNPILVDQEYCPSGKCKKGPSKTKLSNVTFRKIRGSSTTKVAVKLVCSPGTCNNFEVADINLQGPGGPATSECKNIKPKVVGKVVPPACP